MVRLAVTVIDRRLVISTAHCAHRVQGFPCRESSVLEAGLLHGADGRARFRHAARRVRRIRLLIRFGLPTGTARAFCVVEDEGLALPQTTTQPRSLILATASVKHAKTTMMTAMIEVEWSSIALH